MMAKHSSPSEVLYVAIQLSIDEEMLIASGGIRFRKHAIFVLQRLIASGGIRFRNHVIFVLQRLRDDTIFILQRNGIIRFRKDTNSDGNSCSASSDAIYCSGSSESNGSCGTNSDVIDKHVVCGSRANTNIELGVDVCGIYGVSVFDGELEHCVGIEKYVSVLAVTRHELVVHEHLVAHE